jgi:hypothetical protein
MTTPKSPRNRGTGSVPRSPSYVGRNGEHACQVRSSGTFLAFPEQDASPSAEVHELPHGLAAIYIPKGLSRYEQAELCIRLGARRPADLQYLARYERERRR